MVMHTRATFLTRCVVNSLTLFDFTKVNLTFSCAVWSKNTYYEWVLCLTAM